MKSLRTMPTRRLVALLALCAVVLVAGAVAVAAQGGSGTKPPPEPLAQALHDALAAQEPQGISADISFTNKLFPSGALLGQSGSALETGASGRLWANASGGRLELQSDSGDVQITWNDTKVTVYDASSNTAYVATLPQQSQPAQTTHAAPTLDEITSFLTKLGSHWAVSGADPSNVGGEEAYTVTVSPKTGAGLLGSAELAWDALHGTPLRLAVYARGSSSPVLALEAKDISFGPVAESDIAITPPAGAKIVDLSQHSTGTSGSGTAPVSGLAAVQAAVPFTVAAPDTLAGLARQDVRLVGPADSRSVVVVYGEGLGAILVVERPADTAKHGGPLGALPTVKLGSATANELATPLGTVLTWDAGGVSYVLAGSLTSSAAEAAANGLG